MKLNPKDYSLPPRTVLEKEGKNRIFLVINRKSRIIMKDAENIVKKIKKIKTKHPESIIGLKTTAPVCSKSISYFNKNNIEVSHEKVYTSKKKPE